MENMVSDYDIMGKYVLGQSYYDVALLKLLEPLDFNSHVKAICLPTKAFEDKEIRKLTKKIRDFTQNCLLK